jgi:heme/copper-type cytochrome/quinol oxidase subunit 2
MPAEDTVFYVLYDKYMFWSILVAIFTFGWLITAILRYREGVEPDTTNIDHIEVGAFPVDRHNTRLEAMFYIMPTILVVWLTVLALGSNTAVWNPSEEETFEININAYQWYFEFDYAEQLTWEDTGTEIDVLWDQGIMQVDATGTEATTVKVKIGSDKSEYEINNGSSLMAITANYDSAQHAYVKVYDAEDALIHTWENIPRGHTFITPSDPMIVPCDELVDATMKSKSADTTDTRNVGVQHAFWVPEWGMKEDFVPGLEDGTTLYFMPDDSGTFPIRCAEYCGLQHSVMTGQVMVVAREGMTCDYDSGVAKSETSSSDSYDGGES